MMLTPNLSSTWRITYVILGVGLIAGPFVFGLTGWERIALPVLGAMALITAGTGW